MMKRKHFNNNKKTIKSAFIDSLQVLSIKKATEAEIKRYCNNRKHPS
jgi:hypothetical protein